MSFPIIDVYEHPHYGDSVRYENYVELQKEIEFLRARNKRLEEALPDPYKLELLARWIDLNFEDDPNPEVQNDLREWARNIRRALEEK